VVKHYTLHVPKWEPDLPYYFIDLQTVARSFNTYVLRAATSTRTELK
jgi:hypothetical protein